MPKKKSFIGSDPGSLDMVLIVLINWLVVYKFGIWRFNSVMIT